MITVTGKEQIIMRLKSLIANINTSTLKLLTEASNTLRDYAVNNLKGKIGTGKWPSWGISHDDTSIRNRNNWKTIKLDNNKVELRCISPHACIVGGKPKVSLDDNNGKSICSVHEEDFVLSKDGNLHKVVKTHNKLRVIDKPHLVKINCDKSYMKDGLLLTEDHLVLTYNPILDYIYWEEVGKLNIGDYIIKKIKQPYNKGTRAISICEGCGKPYKLDCYKRKYCSFECYNKNTSHNRNEGMKWKLSDERRLEMCGENNPSWMGGISKIPYGPNWTEVLKNKVKKRDDYKCQICGKSNKELDCLLVVHHRDGDKFNNSIDNLTTLCSRCHGKLHWSRDCELVTIDESKFEPVVITKLEHINGNVIYKDRWRNKLIKLYDLSLDNENSFVVNSILVHNSVVEVGGTNKAILDAREYGYYAWPIGGQQRGGVIFSRFVELQQGYHYLGESINTAKPAMLDDVAKGIRRIIAGVTI